MKKILMACNFICVSSMALASSCENLGVTIVNNSPYECVLQHANVMHGYFQNLAPLKIASGSSSRVFYMMQDSHGIELELDYRCNHHVVVFDSAQEHCRFSAGNVWAYPYLGSDLILEHQETMGTYWSGTAGQIIWKIS